MHRIPLVMTTIAACSLGVAQPHASAGPAGTFNLRVVSDGAPDWSSLSNFVHSALSNWDSDFEKARAQFRWSHQSRRVGSFVHEDQRAVLDPILFFNSYGICYCGHISAINCALWEAWGKPCRLVNLPGHVVSEIFYDGAWHMFDHDFSNYFINENGAVASAAELGGSRIHGNVEDLKPGEYYIFDHCPDASAPRGHIFQGPNSWWLIDVARDWYPGPQAVKPRPDIVGCYAGHRYVLGIRPNEQYTRYWKPLGVGSAYARLFANGKDPADAGSPLRNSRANGCWIWAPDLSSPNACFASENVKHTAEGIVAADPSRPATAVFHVAAANVVTSAAIETETRGEVHVGLSMDGGLSWQELTATTPAKYNTELPAGRLHYLLRVELAPDSRLGKLRIETITQVNPRALPRLHLGNNNVVAVCDEQLESLVLQPRLSAIDMPGEVLSAKGWQIIQKPHHHEVSIRATEKAELVLRATAPRRIRRIRMACTAVMTEPSAELFLDVSYDGGEKWNTIGHYYSPAPPFDLRITAEAGDIPADCREVLLRYAFDAGGSGLMNVVAEIAYEPAGGSMPYDVVYAWDEYHRGQWRARSHREQVSGVYHKYAINIAGERPPKMNWLRIEPAGQETPGYSDGADVGAMENPCDYRLVYGRNLSQGCPYEVSRSASTAFPDVDGKMLSNGFIARSSFWKLDKIAFSGEKNERRVGEIAAWEPGGDLEVTFDLGKEQTVGGARIAALEPNQEILFPAEMQVETSTDGKNFKQAGKASWTDCFLPPGDELQWEGWDSPVYDHLPAGGIISYRFPVLFDAPVTARFVRFRLIPMSKTAGIALWELDVFDSLKKEPWSARIRLPKQP